MEKLLLDRLTWWRDYAPRYGPAMMDRALGSDDDWDRIRANGRKELDRALAASEMRTGSERTVLEIGCGLGRLTFALADHFGAVLGLDVSPDLIRRARAANNRPNVSFEVTDGHRIRPEQAREWDCVFSYEVFHYVERATLDQYFRDVHALLVPRGQFVFEVNTVPLTWRTRLVTGLRYLMHLSGKRYWRGWPTAPGFRRKYHPIAVLRNMLASAGFRIERLLDGNRKQTWFVASKP
jgi:SAM-dependent methyltransferase